MKIASMLLGAAGLAAVLGTASAGPAQQTQHAPLQFTVLDHNQTIRTGDVQDRSWAKDNSVLLSTYRHDWYHVSLMGGCLNAGWGGIGFVTQSGDMLDRGASILAAGEPCRIASIDKIEAPPPGSRQ